MKRASLTLGVFIALAACNAAVGDPSPAPDAGEADAGEADGGQWETTIGHLPDTVIANDGTCSPGEIPTAYEVRDLGTFSRDNSGLANAAAINELGHVVGVAEEIFDDGFYTSKPFVWLGGNERIARLPVGEEMTASRAADINRGGEVVGYGARRLEDGRYGSAGFYWDGENDIEPIAVTDRGFVHVNGINDHGLVVGSDEHGAFVWDARTRTYVAESIGLPRPEGFVASLRDINEDGLAVGQSAVDTGETYAMVWSADGGAALLSATPGTGIVYASARAVSALGSVAVEQTRGIESICLLYPAGVWDAPIDLGTVDSVFEIDGCNVEGINRHDAVVGGDRSSAISGIPSRAWVWIDGVKLDLTDMLPAHLWGRWQLRTATDINDDGVIVGIGVKDGIPGRAFVATPVCDGRDIEPVAPPALPVPEVRGACRGDRYSVEALPLPRGGTGAVAFAIDERGRAVGETTLRSGSRAATVWSEGHVATLDGDALNIGRTAAYDINDAGQVVGSGLHRWDDGTIAPQSFDWALAGGPDSLGTLVPFEPSRAWAVDAEGRVAGDIGTELFYFSATRGVLRLGVTVGPSYLSTGSVLAMNDGGQVVGATWEGANRTPFVFDEVSGLRELDVGDADEGEAHAITDDGRVVGTVWASDGPELPVVWDSPEAAPVLLGLLPDTVGGEARGINADGWIVGWDGNDPSHGGAGAWLYREGTKVALDALVDAPEWVFRAAYGISDAGQIVGYGERDGEEQQPFLLTPICD